jgi:hypothetical protein
MKDEIGTRVGIYQIQLAVIAQVGERGRPRQVEKNCNSPGGPREPSGTNQIQRIALLLVPIGQAHTSILAPTLIVLFRTDRVQLTPSNCEQNPVLRNSRID